MESLRVSVNFFSALWGVCRGTEIFRTLVDQRWWRTLLHLMLLTILCSLWITWQNSDALSLLLARQQRLFVDHFGSFKLTERGLEPAKELKSPEKLEFNKDFQLIYCSSLGDFSNELISDAVPDRTLLWFPSAVYLVGRAQSGRTGIAGQYTVWVPKFGQHRSMEIKSVRASELQRFLGEELPEKFVPGPELRHELENLTPQTLFNSIKNLYLGGFFLLTGAEILFYSLFLAAFNALLMTATARRPPFGYGGLFNLGIYAGFPAMIVASFFPAWNLPYLYYPVVFTVGMVVYSSVALRSVVRGGPSDKRV